MNTSNNFFGFNPFAEAWSGRLAMVGFYAAIVITLLTDKGVLYFWGLM